MQMMNDYYYLADLVDKSARISIQHQVIDSSRIINALNIPPYMCDQVIRILKIIGLSENIDNGQMAGKVDDCYFLKLSSDAQAYCIAAALWKMAHPEALNKGLWVCKNLDNASILETGINPSGTEERFYTRESNFTDCNDRYWKRLKCIFSADTLKKVAYLDLFPFHEADQLIAEKTSPELLREFLIITMHRIEQINPALIIIGNKRSTAFWGHHPKYAWMDYDFGERICDYQLPSIAQGINLEVYQIQGFLNRQDRIHTNTVTKLMGSIVINYGYHGRTPHSLTPEITKEMLSFAILKKKMFCSQYQPNTQTL